jgi:hypothetical protein
MLDARITSGHDEGKGLAAGCRPGGRGMSRKRHHRRGPQHGPTPGVRMPSPAIWPVLQKIATAWGIGAVCPNSACRRSKSCTWTHPTCFEREPAGFRAALLRLKPALDRRAAEIEVEQAAEKGAGGEAMRRRTPPLSR